MTALPLGKLPIYFGAAGRPLFGFYHPPSARVRRPMGVLLCNPLGDDLIRAHRTFRHMAETLSSVGFPVLRFDFDGTGDSVGDERDPGRVAAWRGDVGRALTELRSRAGVERVAIVGLRLGGTLAMLASQDLGGVEALVLWSAYETGSAFVSELTRAHKMHTMLEPASFSGGPAATDGQEALGFLVTHETIADLRAMNLLATTASPAKRTLVIDTGNVATENALVAHLKEVGSETTYQHMPGHKFLITTPHHSEVPKAVIDAVTAWLSVGCPPVTGEGPFAASAGGVNTLEPNALGESPVIYGKSQRLFGILHSPPPGAARSDLPVILMANAGTVHRIGAHRTYVPMARRWAALGFYVLRMDLSGIGDSAVADGCSENLPYPRDGNDDIRAAMDFMTETTKINRFVVLGVCSGGDFAFQLGFKEPRVTSAIMVNPRTFCVHELSMIESYQHARWYQRSLLRKESWTKALRGDVDIARVLRIVAPKVRDVVLTRARRVVTDLIGAARSVQGTSSADKPRETDVPKCLRTMAGRGVDTFLLVTEHDPGVDYVDANYSREMQALGSVAGFRRVDVKGTDHTFTARWSQEYVTETITDHLRQRFLAARAA